MQRSPKCSRMGSACSWRSSEQPRGHSAFDRRACSASRIAATAAKRRCARRKLSAAPFCSRMRPGRMTGGAGRQAQAKGATACRQGASPHRRAPSSGASTTSPLTAMHACAIAGLEDAAAKAPAKSKRQRTSAFAGEPSAKPKHAKLRAQAQRQHRHLSGMAKALRGLPAPTPSSACRDSPWAKASPWPRCDTLGERWPPANDRRFRLTELSRSGHPR